MTQGTIGYEVYTGNLRVNGVLIGSGYSGSGAGRDNSAMEAVPNVGPIPKGRYHILRWYNDVTLGPVVAELVPMGHDAHGRTGFRIHGDNKALAHSASHGCICVSRDLRDKLQASGILEVEVS